MDFNRNGNEFQPFVEKYQRDGYVVIPLLDEADASLVAEFARQWVYRLLAPWTAGREADMPLERYHIWGHELPSEHRSVFKAANRHTTLQPPIQAAIVNPRTREFLRELGLERFRIWDEGLGNIAFRFIRPGARDGYPYCAKDWGPAKGVVSFWIPVIGRSSRETLSIAPGSHLKIYPHSMIDDKFLSEPRYTGKIEDLAAIRPELKAGEVICYHGKTLHSEDVLDSDITRLNLEIRFFKE